MTVLFFMNIVFNHTYMYTYRQAHLNIIILNIMIYMTLLLFLKAMLIRYVEDVHVDQNYP